MRSRPGTTAKICLAIFILLTSSIYLLRTVMEGDFFWHLKTGEWIFENRSLPSEDPFASTTSKTFTPQKYFTLTSQWGSQLIYHLAYLACGMTGIVVLRFLLVALLVFSLLRRKEGDDLIFTALLSMLLTALLGTVAVERPHFFSFVFFSMLLFIFYAIRTRPVSTRGRAMFAARISLIMILWANCHGGFILGQVSIMAFLVFEGIKFTHPALRPMSKGAYGTLLISGLAGLASSLINPSTFHLAGLMDTLPLGGVFGGTPYGNIEYYSTVFIFKNYRASTILLVWGIYLLTAAGLVIRYREIDITEAAFLAGTGYYAFMHVRFIPFFLITALPVISRGLSDRRFLKAGRAAVIAAALIAGSLIVWPERMNFRNAVSGEWIEGRAVPVAAAEFILNNNLSGNMFNEYNWGGYLLWRLGPERKVFIDDRGLDPAAVELWWRINSAAQHPSVAGRPFWKAMLDAYQVRYMILELPPPAQYRPPLLQTLLGDPEWVPVFLQGNSIIFVKDTRENAALVKRFRIPSSPPGHSGGGK